MARIAFYCHDDAEHIRTFEYYQQDIQALQELGHTVVVCTRYAEIPSDADALFVWWWTRAFVPALVCRVLGKPCLVTGVLNLRHPQHLQGVSYYSRPLWQRQLIRLGLNTATQNLFVNEQEAVESAVTLGLRNGRHYPCVVHPDYQRGPGSKRRKAILSICWAGRENLFRKGIPDLLQATRILMERGLAVPLVIAGPEGSGTPELRETVHALGLGKQVELLGAISRDRKIELLRECEIYAQPSLYEGFGLATAEAMGCGACVVVCDVGAVRSVVGDAGVYCQPRNPNALADALQCVLENSQLRKRHQEEAVKRSKQLLRFDNKIARLSALLEECGIPSVETKP